MGSKIFLTLSILSIIGAQVSCLTYKENNGVRVIKVNNNYAVSSSALEGRGWKTVSVNEGNAYLITPTCGLIQQRLESLPEADKQLILSETNNILYGRGGTSVNFGGNGIKSITNGQITMGDVTVGHTYGNNVVGGNVIGGNVIGANVVGSDVVGEDVVGEDVVGEDVVGSNVVGNTVNIGQNGISFNNCRVGLGQNKFIISRSNMPNGVTNLVVLDDIIGFVWSNGQILLKPEECLDENERQFLNQLKEDVKREEKEAAKQRELAELAREKALLEAERAREEGARQREEALSQAQKQREEAQRQREQALAQAQRQREEAQRQREQALQQAQLDREKGQSNAARAREQAERDRERAQEEAQHQRELAQLQREQAQLEAERQRENAQYEAERQREEAQRQREQAQYAAERAREEAQHQRNLG